MSDPVTRTTANRFADWWRGDVRVRLYGGVLCVVVLVTTLYSAYSVWVLREEALANANSRADQVAAVLVQSIARPLFDINSVAVTSVVSALGASADVAHIAVLGSDGQIIAEAGQVQPEGDASLIRRAQPIRFADGDKTYSVGLLDVTLRSTSQEADLRARMREVVVANLLLALAIVALLWLLERRMARPFADIESSLNKLATGNTDISLSGLGRSDQIGQMSSAVQRFRQALEDLHAAQVRMASINAGLEQAVQERTRTLAQAVSQVNAGRERLQAVVDHAMDAVVLVEDDGTVCEWNARATEMLGWRAEEVCGQVLNALLQPVGAHGEPVPWVRPDTMLTSRSALEQLVVHDRQGRPLHVEWVVARLAAAAGNGRQMAKGCVFIRDVTARLQAQAQEREALARQAELFALRSTFISMASHEFRTPLTSILSSVEMLRTYRKRLSDDEQDELLVSAEKGVARMTQLLERVLLIGQADAERLAFAPAPVSLKACVDDVVKAVVAQHPALASRLGVTLPEGEAVAHLDADLLGEALGNLLSNAAKYSPEGGRVELLVRAQPGGWSFAVTDHGVGIPASDLPHVFESFHRAGNVGGIAGTGLGLAIVKRAVDLHGGTVSATSQPGLTCFTMFLPDAASDQPAGA